VLQRYAAKLPFLQFSYAFLSTTKALAYLHTQHVDLMFMGMLLMALFHIIHRGFCNSCSRAPYSANIAGQRQRAASNLPSLWPVSPRIFYLVFRSNYYKNHDN
jgi:hypothetical protein